ncbi:hypothetical protein PYCCODRAFT_1046891 [Trametes coccinea BRFM310]|uniref:Uncharacterized protein n=1 Tax=Trametes coccinea (strain BRFM310) TaxID=1353009 RepID=A0A1Y2I9Y5_TRAC3|nr:hypothetical protein PYCCODRAFT_1046891 [Trametes coccinea BRFM310]
MMPRVYMDSMIMNMMPPVDTNWMAKDRNALRTHRSSVFEWRATVGEPRVSIIAVDASGREDRPDVLHMMGVHNTCERIRPSLSLAIALMLIPLALSWKVSLFGSALESSH